MKQKTLQILSLLAIMLMVGVSSVWGGVVSGTTYDTKATSSLPDGWTGSDGGGNTYLQLIASTHYIQTDNFSTTGVTSITLKARTYGGPNETQAPITVSWYSGSPATETVLCTITPTKKDLSDYTINSDIPSISGTGYIKIQCKGASSSKGSGVSQVTITYSAATNQVATPTFSPAAGAFTETQNVELACETEGATIRYTTNGDDVTESSTEYNNTAITVDHTMTIKAKAFKTDMTSSVQASATYTINVFNSLEDLVAADLSTGTTVKVSFENVLIKSISGKSLYFNIQKDGEDIQIYGSANVPSGWVPGGTVSGTMTSIWKKYSGAWELAPTDWDWSLTYNAPTLLYDVNIADNIEHGTVSANMAQAAKGVEVTLTVTPADHYQLGTLSVTDASSNSITVTDNKFIMPASDVTVSATFNKIPQHAAKFFVNGAQFGETQNVYEGDDVTFPAEDPENLYSKQFVGWSVSTINGTTDEVPTLVASATMEYSDLNFYAVFADGTPSTVWVKKAASEITEEGTYAIITTDGHAFNGTIKDGHGQVTSTAFSFVNGVASAAPSGTCEITMQEVTGGYKMYNADNGYLYATAAQSKSLAWHNTEDSYWKYDASNWTYKSNSAFLRSYGNGSIRTYGTNNGDVLAFAKKDQGTTYSNYCTTATETVTISEVGWATACVPFKATVSDAEAYYVQFDGKYLVKSEAKVIPAGAGVLLKGTEGSATKATFTASTEDADSNAETENMMKGSLTGETFSEPNYAYYILANDAINGIGFYYQGATNTTGSTVECAAGKAVLAVPTSAGAKEFLPLDEATCIDKVEVNGQQSTVNGIFNLAGQKVGADYKGIVIVNGKKYLKQ